MRPCIILERDEDQKKFAWEVGSSLEGDQLPETSSPTPDPGNVVSVECCHKRYRRPSLQFIYS